MHWILTVNTIVLYLVFKCSCSWEVNNYCHLIVWIESKVWKNVKFLYCFLIVGRPVNLLQEINHFMNLNSSAFDKLSYLNLKYIYFLCDHCVGWVGVVTWLTIFEKKKDSFNRSDNLNAYCFLILLVPREISGVKYTISRKVLFKLMSI